MLKITLLMAIILIAGCGKAPDEKIPVMDAYTQDLTGKSQGEILFLKYNNQINIHCEVRVHEGEVFHLKQRPDDEIIWPVPDQFSTFRLLNYKVQDRRMVVVIKLASDLKIIPQKNLITQDLREYYMKHTPKIDIRYRRAPKSILSNGEVHQEEEFMKRTLYENVEETILELKSGEDEEQITEIVRCKLLTNINPSYQFQWQLIR